MLLNHKFYQKIRAAVPTICVDLLITNKEGCYLLVKRNNEPAKDSWWFPGGRVLKNESLQNACHRKGIEELGVNLTFGSFISVEESIFYEQKPSIHTVNIVAHMLYNENEVIRLNADHSDHQWCSKIMRYLHPCISNPLKKMGYQYESGNF